MNDHPKLGPEEELSLIPEPLPPEVLIVAPIPTYYDCPEEYYALLPVDEDVQEFVDLEAETP